MEPQLVRSECIAAVHLGAAGAQRKGRRRAWPHARGLLPAEGPLCGMMLGLGIRID